METPVHSTNLKEWVCVYVCVRSALLISKGWSQEDEIQFTASNHQQLTGSKLGSLHGGCYVPPSSLHTEHLCFWFRYLLGIK